MNTLNLIIIGLLLIFGTVFSIEIDELFESANFFGTPIETEVHSIVKRNVHCPGGYRCIQGKCQSHGIKRIEILKRCWTRNLVKPKRKYSLARGRQSFRI